MLSYSSYDNFEPKANPSALITARLNDPQVRYGGPALVLKLRVLMDPCDSESEEEWGKARKPAPYRLNGAALDVPLEQLLRARNP